MGQGVIRIGRSRDFPGGPVVRTLPFQCRGHRFDSWLGKFRKTRALIPCREHFHKSGECHVCSPGMEKCPVFPLHKVKHLTQFTVPIGWILYLLDYLCPPS